MQFSWAVRVSWAAILWQLYLLHHLTTCYFSPFFSACTPPPTPNLSHPVPNLYMTKLTFFGKKHILLLGVRIPDKQRGGGEWCNIVIWHTERGWAWSSSGSRTSPAPRVPKQVCMTLSGGAPIRRPRPRTPLAAQKDARLRIKAPGRHRGSPLLLRASLALLIAGHVSLRDRLPPVQVDRAPAAALRHCLRHHRHRRHLGMGRGRGREVALRQHVGALPGQERRVDLQVAHGLLWVSLYVTYEAE